jgi:thymidylate synthase
MHGNSREVFQRHSASDNSLNKNEFLINLRKYFQTGLHEIINYLRNRTLIWLREVEVRQWAETLCMR